MNIHNCDSLKNVTFEILILVPYYVWERTKIGYNPHSELHFLLDASNCKLYLFDLFYI